MKQAFLVLTDNFNKDVVNLLDLISNSTKGYGDTILLFHQKIELLPEGIEGYNYFVFNNDILYRLGFNPISNNLIPGSNHYPVVDFFLKNKEYDYYWCIEDDVRFSGDWSILFKYFSDNLLCEDFISSDIQHYAENPNWYWWNWFYNYSADFIPIQNRIRSFNPIYRISNRALTFIYQQLKLKWFGHHEILIPTLLHTNNFSLLDFGGDGMFVKKGMHNLFYINRRIGQSGIITEGTMQWRPIMHEIGCIDNKLYHPIKAKSLL